MNKFLTRRNIVSIFICFSLFLHSSCVPAKSPPKAVKGVLDLRDWDFDPPTPSTPSTGSGTREDGIVKLDGEWEFYWGEFPTLDENGILLLPENKKDFIQVPGIWNGYKTIRTTEKGEKIKEEVGPDGFATYRLKVLLKEPRTLSFAIPAQSTAYKFLVDNVVQLEMGEVGKEKDSSIPERINLYKTVSLSKDEFILTIQVSNFYRYNAGLFNSIYLILLRFLIINEKSQ